MIYKRNKIGEVKRASTFKKFLMISVLILFLVTIIVSFYLKIFELDELFIHILFMIAVVASVARSFFVNRFYRLKRGAEIVDFWLFYFTALSNSDDKNEMLEYLLIIPFFKKNLDPNMESLRHKINQFTFVLYFCTIVCLYFYLFIY